MSTDKALPLFALLVAIAISIASAANQCAYTVYVRTGKVIKGGTDAIISARFYDANGYYVDMDNLAEWGGLGGPGYNYFERGNLDVFTGLGECLTTPICALNLTSDGSGDQHGWYCNYVEVTSTGPHIPCSQHQFTIEQWLATDTYPFELNATRDDCLIEGKINASKAVSLELS